MPGAAIPRYQLYGEDGPAAGERFLHIETIARRSEGRDWTIRAHSHAALHHLLIVRRGGGELRVDGQRLGFARAMLSVPAGAVHGFRFQAGTEGHVLTIAEPLIRELAAREAAVARLRAAAHVLPLPRAGATSVLLAALVRELEDARPLAALASEALIELLLVEACRSLPGEAERAAPVRRAAAVVARYRTQIDQHLRDGWTVSDHARALGTSTTRLRAACIEATGQPPVRLLHDRLLFEARRQLAYTDRTVAEIGYELGFDDPAYFARFFRKAAGVPPSGWRRAQTAE